MDVAVKVGHEFLIPTGPATNEKVAAVDVINGRPVVVLSNGTPLIGESVNGGWRWTRTMNSAYTSKKLYLCGGINGLTDDECKNWREYVKSKLGDIYIMVDPMRRDYRGVEDQHVRDIIDGDLVDIKECGTLLVNAEKPSWGTAMEVYQAALWHKCVITVCSGKVSPWLRGHSTMVFQTLDEAIKYLRLPPVPVATSINPWE